MHFAVVVAIIRVEMALPITQLWRVRDAAGGRTLSSKQNLWWCNLMILETRRKYCGFADQRSA